MIDTEGIVVIVKSSNEETKRNGRQYNTSDNKWPIIPRGSTCYQRYHHEHCMEYDGVVRVCQIPWSLLLQHQYNKQPSVVHICVYFTVLDACKIHKPPTEASDRADVVQAVPVALHSAASESATQPGSKRTIPLLIPTASDQRYRQHDT